MKHTPRERMRRYLKQHRLNQDQLAAQLGISAPYLSMILNDRKRPSLDIAARIENLTGIPAIDFAHPYDIEKVAS